MTKASDNAFPSILLEDHVDPAAPSSGFHRLFIDTDEKLKMIDHASLVTDFTPGASGSVASDAIWDAKGDLAGGTGADTAGRLAVGTNGQTLVAASGETTGLKWAVAPAFHGAKAYNSGVQSVNHETATGLTFDSEVFDTDSFHSTSSNTERLTVPTGLDGYYLVRAQSYFAPGTAAKVGLMFLRKNASTKLFSGAYFGYAPGGQAAATSGVVYLAATDYIWVTVFQNNGSAADFGNASDDDWRSVLEISLLGT